MKTLETLLQTTPSYIKWGTERLAQKTGLSISTVRKFKNSQRFKEIRNNYLNN